MKIYTTDLDTLSPDLETQYTIEAKAKYALATDHTHLMDSNEFLFELSVDEEEDAVILTQIGCLTQVGCDDADEDDECDECDGVGYIDPHANATPAELIELIITNSLKSPNPITLEQAQTMHVLASVRNVLLAGSN
jgi:hypothetical protein